MGRPRTDQEASGGLTATQLRELYADPDDIIPAHTLDDLVQGMKRELGLAPDNLMSKSQH